MHSTSGGSCAMKTLELTRAGLLVDNLGFKVMTVIIVG